MDSHLPSRKAAIRLSVNVGKTTIFLPAAQAKSAIFIRRAVVSRMVATRPSGEIRKRRPSLWDTRRLPSKSDSMPSMVPAPRLARTVTSFVARSTTFKQPSPFVPTISFPLRTWTPLGEGEGRPGEPLLGSPGRNFVDAVLPGIRDEDISVFGDGDVVGDQGSRQGNAVDDLGCGDVYFGQPGPLDRVESPAPDRQACRVIETRGPLKGRDPAVGGQLRDRLAARSLAGIDIPRPGLPCLPLSG